jgi:hypothetical protein
MQRPRLLGGAELARMIWCSQKRRVNNVVWDHPHLGSWEVLISNAVRFTFHMEFQVLSLLCGISDIPVQVESILRCFKRHAPKQLQHMFTPPFQAAESLNPQVGG